ncbi:SHOCT domain-containing protein [Moritella sp.]|uniref:SHOCT domain-containing protein n=1 Tax=Moritella sp. TaxID=78556 RepID=UPI001D3B3A63|nr:SHOCT domain-containing protein [Moritella sp.]MCJ8348596.1 SHOCT domain-containing protein [Moritella sp.]NQZ42566.1 SHOCT domain-containing protein [Moritella sp.]
MKMISKKMRKLLLVIALPVLASGCAGNIEKLNADTEFGPAPQAYQQTIKDYFAQELNNPEVAEYVISEPMKFYRSKPSLAGLGGGIKWHAWVAEVGIPGKAVYKYLSGSNNNLIHYYVRFEGNEIDTVYDGNGYTSLKNETGFTVGEYASIDNITVTAKTAQVIESNKAAEEAELIKIFESIRALNTLYKEGIITEEEYSLKKKAILKI